MITRWLTVQDWNGLIGNSSSLLFLAFFSLIIYKLCPVKKTSYSLWGMVAVVLVTVFLYFIMSQSGFLWAQQLGKTEDEVSYSLEEIRHDNDAWRMVDAAFNYHAEDCDDLCRTLRQYTNVHNVTLHAPLRLVDSLTPTRSPRPNIFIFVIDSLRPDFLGSYNQAVDFTPNLDGLARDGVVMRNAFTQYAGTSLSEPAIWAGALLLHSHYIEPFKDANSLLTLARTDGYDVAVSYDSILQKVVKPEEHMTLFDQDKLFMQMEITSTLDQLMHWMSTRSNDGRPILFYAQPMNVHILGRNNLPPRTSKNWCFRPGLDPRISYDLHQVDDAIGVFLRYLKAHGMYEDSIIIVTSDHGEALPGLPNLGPRNRIGHSVVLFPEVMRVPLIVHLPRALRDHVAWDENRLATLTDITPSLYYLLGHRPIKRGFVYGQPLFFDTRNEMYQFQRDHLLLASDAAADYGILSGDGRFLYALYDSPRETLLFDLKTDPRGTINRATEDSSRRYDQQILDDLAMISQFYGHRPTGGSNAHFSFDAQN